MAAAVTAALSRMRRQGERSLMESTSTINVAGHRFHWVWLRDNCHCTQCRDSDSFQKTIELGRLEGSPVPASVRLDEHTLDITWAGEPPPRTTFAVPWLLAHAYVPPAPPPAGEEVLWDARTLRESPPTWHDILDCDAEGGRWADNLARYGFALIDNVTIERLERFASAIGPPHHTELGRIVTV